MKDIQVIVATHKKYQMPEDSVYLPVHVGALGKKSFGFQPDNTGDHISAKNPFFCELTGLYWAWKNLDAEYVGLAHYRRHFTKKHFLKKSTEKKFKYVLSGEEMDRILEKTDVIVPKKRCYYIETLYDHYKHTLYVEPLDLTGQIIADMCPEYYNEFQKLKKRRSAHMFNMFIMKKEVLNGYCSWLFPILFQLEKKVDFQDYDPFHARFFGRISELLLDVYLNTNQISYQEVKVMDMEQINWIKKGFSFLKAKFMNQKYDKSF